jgi:hypothetical protein
MGAETGWTHDLPVEDHVLSISAGLPEFSGIPQICRRIVSSFASPSFFVSIFYRFWRCSTTKEIGREDDLTKCELIYAAVTIGNVRLIAIVENSHSPVCASLLTRQLSHS